MQYRSRWPKELDLNQGDLIQVLFKEDETWWFGRLTNGNEGYFPAACVEPLTCPTGSTESTGSTGLSEVVSSFHFFLIFSVTHSKQNMICDLFFKKRGKMELM